MVQQWDSAVSRLNSEPAHGISNPLCKTSSNPFLLHLDRSCDFRRDFTDVIKIPNQLTLSTSKGRILGGSDGGEILKERHLCFFFFLIFVLV